MNYYILYKNSKEHSVIRKEIIVYALEHGNKAAAHEFQTTVKTLIKQGHPFPCLIVSLLCKLISDKTIHHL